MTAISVLWVFLALSWVRLLCVIVLFLGRTHFFLDQVAHISACAVFCLLFSSKIPRARANSIILIDMRIVLHI